MARQVLSDHTVRLTLRGAEEQVQRLFVNVIRQQLDRAITSSQPTGITQFIDGREGAPIENVKPFGVAVFEFSYLGRIAADALERLKTTSPVREGEYRASHACYVNGALVQPGAIGNAHKALITDLVKYSRVIEVGAQGRVPWSKQAQVPAQGVYRAAAQYLSRKWGGLAHIEFTWSAIDANNTMSGGSKRGARYPAILIEAR